MAAISSFYPSVSEFNNGWSLLMCCGIYTYSHLGRMGRNSTLLLDLLYALYLSYLQPDIQGPSGVSRLKMTQLNLCLVKIPEDWDNYKRAWQARRKTISYNRTQESNLGLLRDRSRAKHQLLATAESQLSTCPLHHL